MTPRIVHGARAASAALAEPGDVHPRGTMIADQGPAAASRTTSAATGVARRRMRTGRIVVATFVLLGGLSGAASLGRIAFGAHGARQVSASVSDAIRNAEFIARVERSLQHVRLLLHAHIMEQDGVDMVALEERLVGEMVDL